MNNRVFCDATRRIGPTVGALLLLALSGCNEEAVSVDPYDITVFEWAGLQCQVGPTPEQSGLRLIQQGLGLHVERL